jgi:enhancing lycopene biosynthesis protein 2
VIGAKVLGKELGAQLTIGDDADTAAAINAMGARHIECPVKEALVDSKNRIVSTPAYMKAQSVAEVYEGVKRTVDEVLRLIG